MTYRKSLPLNGVITYLDGALTERGIATSEVAACCGVTPEAVRQWRYGSHRPTPDNARKMEQIYGLPRYLLRPDLWDAPPTKRRKRREQSAVPEDTDGGLAAVAA